MKLIQGISFLLFCFLLPCSAEVPKDITKIIDKTALVFPKVDKNMTKIILMVETGNTFKPHISQDNDGGINYGIGQVRKSTKTWMMNYYNLPDGKLMDNSYCILICMAYLNVLKTHYRFSDAQIVSAYGYGPNYVLRRIKKPMKNKYLPKYQMYEKMYYKSLTKTKK